MTALYPTTPAKFAKAVDAKTVKFPFQRASLTDYDILQMFMRLSKYDHRGRIVVRGFTLPTVDLAAAELRFKNNNIVLVNDPSDYDAYERIIDMFQEAHRVKYTYDDDTFSPEAYFYRSAYEIAKHAVANYRVITPRTIRESIYDTTNEYPTQKPTHMCALIQMFGARSIFDFEAGWGERLIGAMASNVDCYVGVDKRDELQPGYTEMVSFFNKDPAHFRVVPGYMSTVALPKRKFDMVFTQPAHPNSKFSLVRMVESEYDNVPDWFSRYIRPSLTKSWDLLDANGTLVLGLGQKDRTETLIRDILDHMATLTSANYLGVIATANATLTDPQPLWCWRKREFRLASGGVFLRKFCIADAAEFAAITGDPSNVRWLPGGRTYNAAETANLLAGFIRVDKTMYPVCEAVTGRIVGFIGYFDGIDINVKYKRKNLTRVIIKRDERRQGFATDAYNALLSLGRSMYAAVPVDNVAAIALHRVMRFKYVRDLTLRNRNCELYALRSEAPPDKTYIGDIGWLPAGLFDEFMAARGWSKYAGVGDQPTLVCELGLSTAAHRGETEVKSALTNAKRFLTTTRLLYKFMRIKFPDCKFMLDQYSINAEASVKSAYHVFSRAPVWVAKTNSDDCLSLVSSKQHLRSVASQAGYTITKYLLNPMLISGCKFTIKTVCVYGSDRQYEILHDLTKGVLGRDQYTQTAYANTNVHGTTGCEIGAAVLWDELGPAYAADIQAQITDITTMTTRVFVPEPGPEANHAFDVFQYSFIVDDTAKVWLLHVKEFVASRHRGCEPVVLLNGIVDCTERLLGLARHGLATAPV